MLRGLKKFNLPEIEDQVLRFWKVNDIFAKTLKKNKNKKKFVFFEGPPTANGKPGIHHVLGRAFKDIILRYKTMRGYYVPRRAGWDTHGLPVEIEIERELGLKNKNDIEKFGVAEFNARAKASVWKYKTEWEKLTERVGLWLDFENPYITYQNDYIESLWWVFSQIHKKGLLKKQHKVVPWCPRCQTPLSSHELAQPGAYQKTKDPSLYVKFKIKKDRRSKTKSREFLLIWTTTPWTLPANVAVAVNPKLIYTKYKIGNEYVWSYNPPPAVNGQKIEVVEKMAGKKLVGVEYEPLYKISNKELEIEDAYKVIAADFVSTEEGTGLVHLAPAYGEDDLNAFGEKGVVLTINEDGTVKEGLGIPGEGKFVKEADKDIVADLEKRGFVYKFDQYEHEYPYCWRCASPLLYLARLSWFITMSKLRQKMQAANQKVNWIPEHIKEGRYGDWLKELKDWAISRNRYWGTPLPIWECEECDFYQVIGSLKELKDRSYYKNTYYLVRHGEADHNLEGIVDSDDKFSLTERGKRQIEKIARKLGNKDIEIIYSSPYKRAKETAEIIAKQTGAKVITDKRLAEINMGIFNGRPIKEYHRFYKTLYEKWMKKPPGGENLTEVLRRGMDFLKEVNQKYRNKNIVLVGHGDPLWVLEGAMRGYDHKTIIERGKEFYLGLGEVNEVKFAGGPYDKDGEFDFHRPYIDEVVLACEKCGGKMKRVEGVADVWFDSGAMPFAQNHYPFSCAKNQKSKIKDRDCLEFPADYITEGIDQTRGWFYTLMAVAVALGKGAPYKNVLTFNLVLDKYGRKMSKSKGNVVDPWQIADAYGMDAVRWYFYTTNPPGEPKRFDEEEIKKVMRKVFMILYNAFSFYNTYAFSKPNPLKVMDKWILSRLEETKAVVTKNLDQYRVQTAGRALESLIDDFSRWYIRRTRKNISPATLKKVLLETSILMAPFAPFFADALWQSLAEGSVHLQDWKTADERKIDKKLLKAMEEVRHIAALALAKREESGIKIRQPLSLLKIQNVKSEIKTNKELQKVLMDEVNVKKIEFDKKIQEPIELDTHITPELKEEGLLRELVRAIQGLRHDAGYNPKQKAIVNIETSSELAAIIQRREKELKKAVNADAVLYKKQKIGASKTMKLDGHEVWLGVRKK